MIVVSTTAKSDLFGLMKGSLKFATEINGVPLCEIANILFVGHKVIGMSNDCYNFFSKYAKDYNVKLIKELAVEGAFHTRLMSEAVPQIKLTMKNVTFQKPFCNMYSNLTGKVMCRKTTYIRESLATQVCNPVKWEQIQQLIYKNHKIVNEKHLFPMYFEIGPGQTLGALWAKISKKAYKNYVHISC
ncbi:Malonyl-CoA-acyl carrier protein transacylase, mitochondrial [Strongyloides ratti]|uniref:Malonyl-CoA-acyl carrier protein transacylase, mitochondrial n=1 Tax=Strongyloides ratti TaxID=34506 RepID=A0A090KY11_STRRB|nr:Malonyl-CoA-acyl carrier protein transacylase, mitochondrial [Strongyloides ratti]CEF62306.1 Malonyl-CoA-acyl carrier protein transacylase, mitochondrial [Strongyloides ratti]